MLLRLLLLFTVVPLVELVLLLVLADKTSWQLTLGLVLLTGIVGAALARHQGLRCLRRIHDQLAGGQMPGDSLLDGLMILLAGAVLVTPGILTDLVGFGLLLPPVRSLLKRRLKDRFRERIRVTSSLHGRFYAGDGPPEHDEIIDTRIVDAPAERPDDPR